MNDLFGLSMTTLMFIVLALFATSWLVVAVAYWRGRIMFKMGLRNIGRRPSQSALVVCGLMLATLIITAAFTIGDTVDYGITTETYDTLQRTDLSLHHFQSTDQSASSDGQFYANDDLGTRLTAAFASDPDIEGFVPLLFESVPAVDPRTRLSEPAVNFSGIDVPALEKFGGLHLTNGDHADLAALGPNDVFANASAADKMDIRAGDTLTLYVQGQPQSLNVVGIVRDERASGTLEFGGGESFPGLAAPLSTVQRVTRHPASINSVSVVLRGGVRGSLDHSDAAATRLEDFVATPDGKAQLGLGTSGFQVEKVKQDAIEAAQLAGNVFTTLFLILGLFSIASGVLLIFMIFVMLAAERRQEMGITRAVGAERKHLLQAFLAEGMAYDIGASIVGLVLGVLFAFVLVVGGTRLFVGDQLSFLQAHVTARSLVVSFCLGSILTFATVVGSAFYVSRLNIVSAIRGQTSSESGPKSLGIRWRWILASALLAFIVPPLGIYWMLRRGFGLALVWALVPLGTLLGVALMWAGESTGSSFLFSTGISLLPLMAAIVARRLGWNGRLVWTAAGLTLGAYWLLPLNFSEALFGEFDNSGMEMFVLSGIMIVTALTLVIVFNARVISLIYSGSSLGRRGYVVAAALFGTAGALLVGAQLMGSRGGGAADIVNTVAIIIIVAAIFSVVSQRFPGTGPALKMSIAYPLANRFRTGMTIAMFSLIMFSLTVMSVLNASFLQLFAGDDATGSWDVIVNTNRNNPIDDLPSALRSEGSFDPAQIAALGRVAGADNDRSSIRQPGTSEWYQEIVRGADNSFWTDMQAKLDSRATGYSTDADVYNAVKQNANLAVIDATALATNSGFGGPAVFSASGVDVQDHTFEPFDVEVRNEATGAVQRFTVIGVLSSKIPPGLLSGLLVNADADHKLFGDAYFTDIMLRLAPGVDSQTAAKSIKAALVTQGVQTTSIKKAIDDGLSVSRGFLRLMQAFMGLGLFVGIAAVGVISLRSVVERRQQIGMLRAIGYERHTVALTFLFETAFVALMGVGSGVLGAIILSRNLVTSAAFSGTEGLGLFVPWPEVILFALLAFGFSLLMTWWPSQRAASVPIAEALRYE